MLQLIGYLLCIYLVFKGVEILQIAICAEGKPWTGLVLGVLALLAALGIAVVFGWGFMVQASSGTLR